MTPGTLALCLLAGYVLWRVFIVMPHQQVERRRLRRLIESGGTLQKGDDPALAPCTTVPSVAKTPEEDFILVAKDMFRRISSAYAAGDKKALEELVSPYVLERFSEAIDKRIADKLTMDFELGDFEQVEIERFTYRLNEVRVRFITTQVNYIKNDKDEIVSGIFGRLRAVSDVWEFERRHDVMRAWKLVATQSESLL